MTGCDVSGGGAGSVRGASVHPPQHREPPATLPRIKLGSPSQTRRARTMWSRSRSLGVPTGETSLLLTILQPRGSTRPRAGPRTCGDSVGTPFCWHVSAVCTFFWAVWGTGSGWSICWSVQDPAGNTNTAAAVNAPAPHSPSGQKAF